MAPNNVPKSYQRCDRNRTIVFMDCVCVCATLHVSVCMSVVMVYSCNVRSKELWC